MSSLRTAAIRALMPRVWQGNPQRAAVALHRFGTVEADSAWQYHQALVLARGNPELQRMLFSHMMEELDHASRFHRVSSDLRREAIQATPQQRRQLAQTTQDLPYFLAYVHLSEKAIHHQFGAYAAASHDPRVRGVFNGVRDDEAGHEGHTLTFLTALMGYPATLALIRKARWSRIAETCKRSTESFGDFVAEALLRVVFVFFGAATWRPGPKAGRRGASPAPHAPIVGPGD